MHKTGRYYVQEIAATSTYHLISKFRELPTQSKEPLRSRCQHRDRRGSLPFISAWQTGRHCSRRPPNACSTGMLPSCHGVSTQATR